MKSTWNFAQLKKKDPLDTSNILEVIDSEKCDYLNAKKLFTQNNLLQSTCSQVPNTAQICTASLLSEFSISSGKFIWKTYLSIQSKMFGLSVNTLMSDHMYSAHFWEKIQQQNKTQFCEKPKTISQICITFFKSTWNFAHLEKKYQLDSSNILEVIDSEKCSCLNAKKLLFQNTLQESTCSRLPKTVPVCAAWFLS